MMKSQPIEEHSKDATAIRFMRAPGRGGGSVTGASWDQVAHTLLLRAGI